MKNLLNEVEKNIAANVPTVITISINGQSVQYTIKTNERDNSGEDNGHNCAEIDDKFMSLIGNITDIYDNSEEYVEEVKEIFPPAVAIKKTNMKKTGPMFTND